MGIKLNGCNFGSCGQIKDVSLCNKILPFRSTNYPLKSLFSMKWIGSSKSQKGMSVTVAHENT